MKKRTIFNFFIFCFFFPKLTFSCPSFTYAYQIPYKNKYLFQRKNISLFILEKGKWKQKPVQINSADRRGVINFSIKKNSLLSKLERFDRLTVNPDDFSKEVWQKGLEKPCSAETLIQLRSQKYYGYLAFCNDVQTQFTPVISYDDKARAVSAPQYKYIHDQFNHLSFEGISLLVGDKYYSVAGMAEQVIRADVKNFFNMNFTASDIRAKLKSRLPGSVGLLGLLQFYLRIFFFSIELALTPEVQFFNDSLFMPMSLHSPVDANKYINSGSGIFYSWKTYPHVTWDLEGTNIPSFQGKNVFPPLKLATCRARRCSFFINGRVENRSIGIRFSLNKRLADLNFYPQLMLDMNEINKAFGEQISKTPEQRMGVYFETSQLPKGDHIWDFWISMGKSPRRCPSHVSLMRVI